MESKKRVFGTDITNNSFKRNKMDYTDDEMKSQVKSENCLDAETYIWMQPDQKLKCTPKSVDFGPFRPINLPKVGDNGKNNVKKVQDWENIASSYRPQYHNQGTFY